MNGYELSRKWFDWSFENTDLISPTHTAIYFFAIDHCNRLGWKEKFSLPTHYAMEAIGIKKVQTFTKHLDDLVKWGFIEMVQKSKNQYTANIITLKSGMPKNGNALDKAMVKHEVKQGKSMRQSMDTINKHITLEQETIKHEIKFQEPIHPLQQWVRENCPRVSKLKKQLTFDEAQKIASEFNIDLIHAKLLAMENKAKLDYVSVNLTLRNWLSKEQMNPSIPSFSNYQTEPIKNPRSRP
jgi:hypothetical protein